MMAAISERTELGAIRAVCAALGVARSSFYRRRALLARPPIDPRARRRIETGEGRGDRKQFFTRKRAMTIAWFDAKIDPGVVKNPFYVFHHLMFLGVDDVAVIDIAAHDQLQRQLTLIQLDETGATDPHPLHTLAVIGAIGQEQSVGQ